MRSAEAIFLFPESRSNYAKNGNVKFSLSFISDELPGKRVLFIPSGEKDRDKRKISRKFVYKNSKMY